MDRAFEIALLFCPIATMGKYQVLCLIPMETFSQVEVLTLQSSYGKDGLIFRYI